MKKCFNFLTESLICLGLVVCVISNCAEDYDYIELEYADFMSESCDDIADNLAEALEVTPITYSGKVMPGSISDELGQDFEFLKEGFQYITVNDAKITIYVDEDDQPYVITYLLRRQGTSDDWTYDQEEVNSHVRYVLTQVGITSDGSEDFSSHQCAGISVGHYYDILIKQTFSEMPLEYPYIHAEIEGETGEINFLKICRWYVNFDEIDYILSDDDLASIAANYFNSSYEVISILDLDADGYYINKDRLCRMVGRALIDEWGSSVSLLIDIQSGEIVDIKKAIVY